MQKHKVLWWIMIIACILFIIGCCCSCTFIPKSVEDSVHLLHAGNIIICNDYVSMLLKHEPDGEKRNDKLRLVEKHLKLSQELDTYLIGKGDKLKPIWKGDDNGVE